MSSLTDHSHKREIVLGDAGLKMCNTRN